MPLFLIHTMIHPVIGATDIAKKRKPGSENFSIQPNN
jgi:hypothetical protein